MEERHTGEYMGFMINGSSEQSMKQYSKTMLGCKESRRYKMGVQKYGFFVFF